MSKLVTLDEQEEYERELQRAHAENRAPRLRDPHDVYADNIGNAESHLEELSEADAKKATSELHKRQQADKDNDKRLKRVIRKNTQATPQSATDAQSVAPYQAPDPDRYKAPSSDAEKEYADRQVDHLATYGQKFDDSFSDVNIPNTDDEGRVLGDSVNPVLTRKMTTFSPDELVRENEANTVPVPEKFKTENPPQVVQQSNPITHELPTPETVGYVEGYAVNTDENTGGNPDAEGKVPTPDDVPHTAITTPRPEHVIGDETGTTREISRENETDVSEPADAPEFPNEVPLSQGQVAQGAVKRPDHFKPPTDNPETEQLSENLLAANYGSAPVDAPPGLRDENPAQEAAKEALAVQLPDNVDPVNITDEQRKLLEKTQKEQ